MKDAIVAVITGFIGLAIVAVIVSRNAQTPNVLGAFGTALARIIGAAVAPVTGARQGTAAPAAGGGIQMSGSFSLPQITIGGSI